VLDEGSLLRFSALVGWAMAELIMKRLFEYIFAIAHHQLVGGRGGFLILGQNN